MLIGEQPDGSVTELDSRDFYFIENEFPNICEVEKNLTLYEMMDQEGGAPSRLVEDKEEIPETPRDSGSDLQPSGSTPLEVDLHNTLSHVEATMVIFLTVILRLRGELS